MTSEDGDRSKMYKQNMVKVSVIVGEVLHVDINPFLKGKQCFYHMGLTELITSYNFQQ